MGDQIGYKAKAHPLTLVSIQVASPLNTFTETINLKLEPSTLALT